MARPLAEEVEQNEDLAAFTLAQSYFQMQESAAWKDLAERIQALVDEAEQEHFSSRETEPLKIIEEKVRWQQRKLFQVAINNIVAQHLDKRAVILEEMNEHDTAE